jgi:hypothetical protein
MVSKLTYFKWLNLDVWKRIGINCVAGAHWSSGAFFYDGHTLFHFFTYLRRNCVLLLHKKPRHKTRALLFSIWGRVFLFHQHHFTGFNFAICGKAIEI